MQIRKLRVTDVTRLMHLEKSTFVDYYRAHRLDDNDFVRYLSDPRTIAFGAYHLRSLIGYILGVVYGGQVSHVAKIYSLAVARDWRRQGIGARLTDRFIRGAIDRGCTVISLEVATPNITGQRFFKELGFKIVRNLPRYYGDNVDGKRMRLAL